MTITGDFLLTLHDICFSIYAYFVELGRLFVNGTMTELIRRVIDSLDKIGFGNEWDIINPIAWGNSFLRLINEVIFYQTSLGTTSPIVFFLSSFVFFSLGLKFLKLLA